MDRFWVIDYLKKVLFFKKKAIIIIFLLSYFWTLFAKNGILATQPSFLNRW